MPEQHTITAVSEKTKTWQGQQGSSFIDYFVKTDVGGETVYTHTRKPDSPRPQVGENFEAEVQPSKGDHPPKLKRISQRPSGGGQRPMGPDERRSIERQVAAKCTAEVMAAFDWGPTKPSPTQVGIAFAELFAVVDQCIRGDA